MAVTPFIRTATGLRLYQSGGTNFVFNFADRLPKPVMITPPSFTLSSGTAGEIGASYNINIGTWSGSPVLSHVLYRNDQIIEGSEDAASYTLIDDDDRAHVFIRVAAKVEGWPFVYGDSVAIAVTYAAPSASGTISNIITTQAAGFASGGR